MNLAEIRKKAAKAEVPVQEPVATGYDAAASMLALASEPSQSSAPVAPIAAVAPVAPIAPVAPVASAGSVALIEPTAASLTWQPEQMDALVSVESGYDDEPGEFNPADVILKGRETCSFEVEDDQKEDADAASVELLCFRVANEEYAISIMDIKEIIKPREVTEVPRVPPFVRGILSLRGNIIPIFDMRVRLGLPGISSSERERVVVVKRQGGFCGVLVDEVVQVVRIAETGIEPPPVVLEGIDRDFVQGIGRVNGRMLILLDMEKVLDVSLL